LSASPVLIAAGVAAAALIGGFVVYLVKRPSAAERERRRRLKIHREGRITDGTVFDVGEPAEASGPESERLVFYTYSIGGVDYSACQDVSALTAHVGENPARLIGSVYVKYQAKNPYNSIVVCEEWSGLRQRGRD
jgi:hypothetical protein